MRRIAAAILTVGVAGLFPALANAQLPTTNLLTNPGAETGNISGWTLNEFDSPSPSQSTPSVDNGTFDSSIKPHSGSFDFVGSLGGATDGDHGELTQSVSLISAGITNSQVDGGGLQANISFWEQGLSQGTPSDDAEVILNFLDGTSTTISTASSGFVDSHNGTWQNFTGSFAIPVGTRQIAYSMFFQRNSGSDLDAFVDDNSLIVANASLPAAAPEPGSLSLLAATGGLALIGLRRRRRARCA